MLSGTSEKYREKKWWPKTNLIIIWARSKIDNILNGIKYLDSHRFQRPLNMKKKKLTLPYSFLIFWLHFNPFSVLHDIFGYIVLGST